MLCWRCNAQTKDISRTDCSVFAVTAHGWRNSIRHEEALPSDEVRAALRSSVCAMYASFPHYKRDSATPIQPSNVPKNGYSTRVSAKSEADRRVETGVAGRVAERPALPRR
jgi:hypothetical protein